MEKNDRKKVSSSNVKQEKSSQRSTRHQKQDPAWNYASETIDSRGRKVTACDFCGKQYVGSEINRMKHHLAGLEGSRSACPKVSSKIQQSMRKSLEENKEKRKEIIILDLEMEEDEVDQRSHQSCSTSTRKRKRETKSKPRRSETMAESAKQHIDRIRKTKFSIGGADNPLTEDLHQAVKNLSAELYAKDVHFLMELIQNAEDNEYPQGVDPSLEFVITSEDITATGAPATLLIFNNENGFSEKNIESICSVGRSTKKGNRKRGYIGEKGIGFKSVFLITSQPHIFSNGYQIRFNEAPCSHCSLGYIVPEWVEQHPSLVDIQRMYGSGSALPTTTIILPLKSDKVKPVKEQLSNVHPEVLLFLSKIKRLSIREYCQDPRLSTVNSIGIVSETNFVTTKSIDAESYTIHLSASEKGRNSEQECSYYMWRQKFPVKHENRVDRRSEVDVWVITLAFPFGERLGRGNSSPGIYAFLPTEMVTNFPFIIQADFILASSRETILLDDIWNQGILSCVCTAFVDAFTSLVNKTEAPVSSLVPTFRFLPVEQSTYTKLNVVRDSIKAKISAKQIVPSISHLGQKFFHRPCEVGRLIPAFWDILEKAREEGASLQNISSHGIYILDSSFDRTVYDNVLEFLGLKQVSNEWYVKCIQGCDLVTSVSEGTYVEVLLFIAENWQSRFQSTNMVKVPLIKYVVQKGVSSLSSLAEFNPRTLCLSTEKNQAWLLDWNDELKCMYNFVFMPQTTRTAFKACSKKETIHNWLKEKIKVANLSVSDYEKRLRENLNGDKRLVVAYAHFLHHSLSKDLLSEEEAGKCCKDMPLVDNYGNVNTSRNGVLVPASSGKWVSLVGSNPWRQNGYIELSEEYLSSDRFAGLRSNKRDLLEFLKSYVKAGDIPDIEPPNAAIPALSGALKKENVLLLLEWIKRNRHALRSNFLDSVRGGSWLRTTMNGFSDYRPPSQSFYHTSSWGSILQNGSILVDIPLVDRSYYGKEIENYKDELKTAGVMFDFSEACAFVGNHLMSLAETSTLSSENVFSILKFIKYLREKRLPPADFIAAVKDGQWLKTSSGYRSPDGAVLFSQDWKAASLISDIPFIDRGFYGEVSLSGYKEELELLGVVVKFPGNHSLIVSHLNTSKLMYLTPDAMLLVLDCMRHLSPHRLINALKNSQCFKTKKNDYKSPAECFIPDPERSCLVSVFDCFPLIDDGFYGSRVFSYKEELKQIGVKVQLEDVVKEFVHTFKEKATSSRLTQCTSSSLLSCYRQLMGSFHKFPVELVDSFKKLKWLQTKLGDFRAPTDCILFDADWEPLRLIANLPFIDDSSNWYGKSIYDYKKELQSLDVTVELRKGMSHVVRSLSLPDPSRITPASALSLFKCFTFLIEDRNYKLLEDFLDKVSGKWLKTHVGYRSPSECLLFDSSWKLEPCDGPFIDEEYYGSELKSFREELIQIGVGHTSAKACELLASHIYAHSETDSITRIYGFLNEAKWEPKKDASLGRIWLPSDEKWADVSSCVLYDKGKLFGSRLNVLENHYKDHELLAFFSSVFGVRTNPSIEDYCGLWKDWERTKEKLSNDECCAFWSFVVRHNTRRAEKLLSESFTCLPVHALDCNSDEGVMLANISDVFIADDLLLKDLFINSPVFVWYPTPSIPALSRTKLVELYRQIGVKEISKCVTVTEAELSGVKIEQQEVNESKSNLIGPGLVKLILGFLSDPSLKVEAEERSRMIQCLVDIDVKETLEAITTEYTLNLPSKGEKLIAKAKRMIRWEREKGVVYAEKLEKACGKRKVLEYATCFADVIAKGVMWEREDLIGRLSELVKMAYLVEFDEEALEFLMKSKNLQVYEEDEKLISDEFSLK